ncbi:MAG: hypothetical protein OXH75_08185 [Acidobacteria bacterium]|nr:hypothetical protein [Acidobacteriota bacterium]
MIDGSETRSFRRTSQVDAEVIRMSQWAEVRQRHLVEGVPKKEIARRLRLDVKTVRRAYPLERLESLLDGIEPAFRYYGGGVVVCHTAHDGAGDDGSGRDSYQRARRRRGGLPGDRLTDRAGSRRRTPDTSKIAPVRSGRMRGRSNAG